jgi:hypothetical protein
MGPHPTQNCDVLDLGQNGVPLLCSLYNDSKVQAPEEGTRPTAQISVILVTNVSTVHQTSTGSGDGVLLQLEFWVSNSCRHPAFLICVTIPKSWSVKMYLLALHVDIKKSKRITPHRVESWAVSDVSGCFISINERAFHVSLQKAAMLELPRERYGSIRDRIRVTVCVSHI